MKKVYFLKIVLLVFVFFGQIRSRDSIFTSYIAQASKMVSTELLLDTLLKEVNLPFLVNFQKHVTTLEQLTKLSQVTDLQAQLELVKTSSGEIQAAALQKAVADFQTLIPLIDYLFKKDNSGNGLITEALHTLNQESVANSLGKMTTSIDLVAETSMLLVNTQDQEKALDNKPVLQDKLPSKPLTKAEQKIKDIEDTLALKMAALDAKLAASQTKIDTKLSNLDAKLSAKNLIIDQKTRDAANNLHPQKTDAKVWEEKETKIGKSSLIQRIQFGVQAADTAPKLIDSFNKLNFDALVAKSKEVNSGKISYKDSGITPLLKDISVGIEEIIGTKDSFSILVLRVIGTAQAVSIANRLITTSKTITTFMNTIADIVLLSQIMKSLPSKNAPIPAQIEEWPAVTEGELDFS